MQQVYLVCSVRRYDRTGKGGICSVMEFCFHCCERRDTFVVYVAWYDVSSHGWCHADMFHYVVGGVRDRST